jgi:hypothetical protein
MFFVAICLQKKVGPMWPTPWELGWIYRIMKILSWYVYREQEKLFDEKTGEKKFCDTFLKRERGVRFQIFFAFNWTYSETIFEALTVSRSVQKILWDIWILFYSALGSLL